MSLVIFAMEFFYKTRMLIMSQNSNIIEILSNWLVRSFDQVLNDSCVNYILSRPLSSKEFVSVKCFPFLLFFLY